MFKKFSLLVVAAFSVVNIFAQKADWEKVPVSYLQLPTNPISPMANKYLLDVVMDSDNIVKNMVQQRQNLVQSINNTNALLAQQGGMPEQVPVDYNYYPVNRDPMTVKTHLKLDGCQEVSSSPQFILKVNVAGFSLVNTALNSTTASYNGVMTKVWFFDVSYLYKITYQVYDGSNGALVREGMVYGSDVPQKKQTKQFVNQYELEGWWSVPVNKNSFLVQCDNEAYESAMSRAHRQLNSELGYSVINNKIEVATFKDAAYADLQGAFANASMGYEYLSKDKTKAFDYISKAIDAWEKALTESNATEKHARINEHVIDALYVNLAIAYCFMENWEKSNSYIVKLKSNTKEHYKTKLKEAEELEIDYEKRTRANASK